MWHGGGWERDIYEQGAVRVGEGLEGKLKNRVVSLRISRGGVRNMEGFFLFSVGGIWKENRGSFFRRGKHRGREHNKRRELEARMIKLEMSFSKYECYGFFYLFGFLLFFYISC